MQRLPDGRAGWPDQGRSPSRRLREDPFDILAEIAETIGPRRATSLAEAQAAAYLDGRLRRAGLRVSVDALSASASTGWDGVLLGVLAALSTLLYYWFPLPSLGLAIWSLAIAVWRAWRHNTPLLVRRRASQNVIGTRVQTPQSRWRVVLLAPLDSPPLLIPAFRWLRYGRRLAIGRVVACTLLVIGALLGLADAQRIWLYSQCVPVSYLLLAAVIDLSLIGAAASDGATNHAGALATLLASATTLSMLEQVELWVVGLGASISGAGLADLLRRYPFEPERTLFIGLESLGSGRLSYVTGEGFVLRYPADPLLLQLVGLADAADPVIDAEPRSLRSRTILGRQVLPGWRGLIITCRDPSGEAPGWASRADSVAAIDPAILDRAVRLVVGLVQRINATPGDAPLH